jgi:hypothetical protein
MARDTSGEMLWSQIVANAWCDEALMTRLLSEPRKVLAEHSLEFSPDTEVVVSEGEEVKVVAESDGVRRFFLTVDPPVELTDEDLVGGAVSWCGCVAACARCARCAACAACGRCGACGCRCW